MPSYLEESSECNELAERHWYILDEVEAMESSFMRSMVWDGDENRH